MIIQKVEFRTAFKDQYEFFIDLLPNRYPKSFDEKNGVARDGSTQNTIYVPVSLYFMLNIPVLIHCIPPKVFFLRGVRCTLFYYSTDCVFCQLYEDFCLSARVGNSKM